MNTVYRNPEGGRLDLEEVTPGSKVLGRFFVPGDSIGYEISFIFKKASPLGIKLMGIDPNGNNVEYELYSAGHLYKRGSTESIGIFVLDAIHALEEPKTNELIQGTVDSVAKHVSSSRIKAQEYILSLREGDNISLRSHTDGSTLRFTVESGVMSYGKKKGFSFIQIKNNNSLYKYVIIVGPRGIDPNNINLCAARVDMIDTLNNPKRIYRPMRRDLRLDISETNLREIFSLVLPE